MVMEKIKTSKILKTVLIFLTSFLLSQTATAYLSVGETAEILPEGFYKLGLQPQLILSDSSGFNMGVYFDTYLADSLNGRVEIGAGKTDFWTTASVKWVPIPDVDRQPALGIRGGLIYARSDSSNFYNFQITPIVSKKADTRYGEMVPFVALPITFLNTNSKSLVATQFAIGAEWFQNKDVNYGGELDMNMSNSFTSVSAFISFPFDGTVGYKK